MVQRRAPHVLDREPEAGAPYQLLDPRDTGHAGSQPPPRKRTTRVAEATSHGDVLDRDHRIEVATPWPMVRIDVGASFIDRRLSYDIRTGFSEAPPQPITYAGTLRLEYSRIVLSFDRMNNNTNGRDGDLSTKDINGATDRSIGVVATIGMAY